MEKIDSALLERLQNLSMLTISPEQKEKTIEELNRFLEFVDILNELDLRSLEATFNPIETSAPLRKDDPHSDPTIPQKILRHAPKSVDNFFIVPKIIE